MGAHVINGVGGVARRVGDMLMDGGFLGFFWGGRGGGGTRETKLT
jgi:hypothetical protein